MRYIDKAEYTLVPGDKKENHIRVYALSTCAFCERAMNFLRDRGYEYEFIFLDQIDVNDKRAMKAELKAQFGSIPVFPLLVLDHSKYISGFVEDKWIEFLSVAASEVNGPQH
jgi:glutaredoxin